MWTIVNGIEKLDLLNITHWFVLLSDKKAPIVILVIYKQTEDIYAFLMQLEASSV